MFWRMTGERILISAWWERLLNHIASVTICQIRSILAINWDWSTFVKCTKWKKWKEKNPDNRPFRSPAGFSCFPFPSLEQMKSKKSKNLGLVGDFFFHWKNTDLSILAVQECRSEMVLGKTSRVERDSYTWMDYFMFLFWKHFIFKFILGFFFRFVYCFSFLVFQYYCFIFFIFSSCKIWRQQFLANSPLDYSKCNLSFIQGFATALLACITSYFISVSLFPSTWNRNDV